MWRLIFLVAAVQAQSSEMQTVTIADYFFKASLRLTTSTITTREATCTASADSGATNWAKIVTYQNTVDSADCPRGTNASVSFQGVGSNRVCAAAHSTKNDAGRLCSARGCAQNTVGQNGGIMCHAYKCAAGAKSGCPAKTVAPAYTTLPTVDNLGAAITFTNDGEYTACCTSNHGSGCVAEKCAEACKSEHCGQHSIGASSAKTCAGTQCGAHCEGVGCAENCEGNKCGHYCWQPQCARNCSGTSCGSLCMGVACAANCTGWSCGQFCKGTSCAESCNSASCGQNCAGSRCAALCDNLDADDANPCGQFAIGTQSAFGCRDHGCGAYCIGQACAYNASSVYTSTALASGTFDTLSEAMICYNEWVLSGMNTNFALAAIAAALAPTSAPTALPTAPTPAPTSFPTITFAPVTAAPVTVAPTSHAPSSARRARDITYDSNSIIRRALQYDAEPANNNTCPLVSAPPVNLIQTGPGRSCIGQQCATNATGAFAGAFCVGDQCAKDAKGLYAGVACVGTQCGMGAGRSTDFGAASFCMGTECGKGAIGPWAASYCIGNGCAQGCVGQRCGTCCVGLNCSSNSTGLCPSPTDSGTPLDMGGANKLFSDGCRIMDTTNSAWTTFLPECAGGSTTAVALINTNCVITCDPTLTSFLRYYQEQTQAQVYANKYVSSTLKLTDFTASTSSDDGLADWAVALIAVAATLGAVGVGVAVYKATPEGTYERFRPRARSDLFGPQ